MPRRASSKRPLIDFLVENYFATPNDAEEGVKLGVVSINSKFIKRSGVVIDDSKDVIKVIGGGRIYVSRGGYKLQEALEKFEVDVTGRVCLDIGASTGGFTDCLLQHGAKEVYAIDTGYGQLAWKLRTNSQVHCVERMNVRFLMPEKLYLSTDKPPATLAVIDVSFISVLKILGSVQRLLSGKDQSQFVILIKPQFEAGKNSVARGGLIKNPLIHRQTLVEFISGCYRAGLDIKRLMHSPLLGASGNLEFLAYATWPKAGPAINPRLEEWVQRTVDVAYEIMQIK